MWVWVLVLAYWEVVLVGMVCGGEVMGGERGFELEVVMREEGVWACEWLWVGRSYSNASRIWESGIWRCGFVSCIPYHTIPYHTNIPHERQSVCAEG